MNVKVRIAAELMEQWATRDESGRRLEWDWGEPDAEGFHTPTVTVVGPEGTWFTVDSLAAALHNIQAASYDNRWMGDRLYHGKTTREAYAEEAAAIIAAAEGVTDATQ